MAKLISVIVLLFLTFTFLGIVAASDSNDSSVIADNTVSHNNQVNVDSHVDKQVKELDDEDVGTGCSSVLLQGYNNDSALSFRRDATNKLTVNVKHDNSMVKQYKEGSYFFHAIVSKDGWMVGNGGADNAQVNHAIEDNAISMIKKNSINYENMNNIYKQESRLSLGHFVIKSPNGTYSLIIKNGRRVFKDSGVLKSGQYLIVPNSVNYFKKNSVGDIGSESSMISTSRMLTARDRFGVNRREIVTYYYKNNRVNSTVKVTVTNDNGMYAGRRTAYLVDNFRTNTKYFSSSSIPVIDGFVHLDTVNFFLRKTRTSIKSHNITSDIGKVILKANVKDEFGLNVNSGKVLLKVDGKTLKYSNGKTRYIKVVDGKVNYTHILKNLWTKKNHTYSMNYIGNSKYENSKSNNAQIQIKNFFTLKTYHNTHVYYGNKLNIKTILKYKNNTPINGGKVLYKINGKTILNSKNQTLYKIVNNGQVLYNYTLNSKFKAKSYVLTTVYINGLYRKEYNTNITIKKIPQSITSHNINKTGNTIHFTAKLVDKYQKTVTYNTYLTVKINDKTLKTKNNTQKFIIKEGNINFKFKIPQNNASKTIKIMVHIPESKEALSYNKNYTIKV